MSLIGGKRMPRAAKSNNGQLSLSLFVADELHYRSRSYRSLRNNTAHVIGQANSQPQAGYLGATYSVRAPGL